MAIRATELVIIAKVNNQASAQLRRLAADVGRLGSAARTAEALGTNQIAQQKQLQRIATTTGRIRTGAISQSERLLQVNKDLYANETQRMRVAQRLSTLADPGRIAIARRELEATYMRENVLLTRQNLYLEQGVQLTAQQTAQLKLQQGDMQKLIAQHAQLAKLQQMEAKAGQLRATGRAMSSAGRSATFTGLLATAGFGIASSQFAEFDRLTVKAATQIGDDLDRTVTEIIGDSQRLQTEIKRLMGRFPATAEEMADSAYQIFSSMEVNFGGGIKLLKEFNKVAVAMGGDLATATNVGITVLNNFADSGTSLNQTLDTMATIIRLGRLELSEFDSMMNKIAPSAKGADQTLQDVAGAMAAITRLIPSQDIAATALARLMGVFTRKDFQEGMDRAGQAIVDNEGHLIDFVDIIGKIVALDPDLQKGGAKLQNLIQTITAFGRGEGRGIQSTEQARRALVQLVTHYPLLVEMQRRASDSQGELNKRLAAMEQSFGVRWQVFINQLRLIVLEIGEAAIPAFMRLFKWIRGLKERWDELSPEVRKSIIYFSAMAGIIMLIGGPILVLVGGIISLIGVLRILSIALGGVGAAGVIGRLAMLFALLTRLSLIGIITITVVVAFKKSGDASQFVEDKLRGLQDFFGKKGISGAAAPIKALRDLNDLGTWDELDKGDSRNTFFNPKAKLYTPATKRQFMQQANILQKDLERIQIEKGTDPVVAKMLKDLKKVKNQVVGQAKLDEILKTVEGQLNDDVKALENWKDQRTDVIKQATEQAEQIMEQAASSLVNKFVELRNANASAFGELFQGPVLTGEAFKTAEEWGIVPDAKTLTEDLQGQIKEFTKWHSSLAAIGKKGAPSELVKELAALGPDAVDKLEALRQASPKMFNRFIAVWKQKQAVLARATKADFDKQLNEWFKYGKGIAFKIIAGLETEEQALQNKFRTMLKESFSGSIITEVIAEALAEYEADNPKPAADKKPKPKPSAKPKTGNSTTNTKINSDNKTNISVTAAPGESAREAARRTSWELARRGRTRGGRPT